MWKLSRLTLGLACILLVAASPWSAGQPNILWIMADDLGYDQIEGAHTPNLDRLAAVSTEFRGYCNFPWCNPSRCSMFSGLRPEFIQIYNNNPHPADVFPARPWMQKQLREAGYWLGGVGKIFHRGTKGYNIADWDDYRYPGFSDPLPTGPDVTVVPTGSWSTAYFENDVTLRDQVVGAEALSILEDALARESGPWGVFVGFFKPHLPLYCHRQDWEANTAGSDEDFLASLSGYPFRPILDVRLSLEQARSFRRGYRSCITHIDRQIGPLLDAIEAAGELDNTLIVFTSDHGYGTGQLGRVHYSKVQPHEACNRVPLLMHLPGQTQSVDRRDLIVELIDLYPTLLDFGGASKPPHHGQSLQPMLTGATDGSEWKNYATQSIMPGNRNRRYRRLVTPEAISYVQMHDGGGTYFDHATDPNQWTSQARSADDPKVTALFASVPPPRDLVSPAVTKWVETDRRYVVTFPTEPYFEYTVERSPDLLMWEGTGILTGSGESERVVRSVDSPLEFFRVRQVSPAAHPVPLTITPSADAVRLTAAPRSGHEYFIRRSRDLQSWTRLGPYPGSGSGVQVVFPTGSGREFFEGYSRKRLFERGYLDFDGSIRNGELTLGFDASQGSVYRVEGSEDIHTWNVRQRFYGDGQRISYQAALEGANGFYRLRRERYPAEAVPVSFSEVPSANAVRLQFSSLAGRSYQIETSHDLVGWRPRESFDGTGGAQQVDRPMGEAPFYRINLLPSTSLGIPIASTRYQSNFHAEITFDGEPGIFYEVRRVENGITTVLDTVFEGGAGVAFDFEGARGVAQYEVAVFRDVTLLGGR